MRYLVVDTETSDATDQRGVCEVAWVEIDEHWHLAEQVTSLIDPEKPISPAASGVHGLTYDDVKDAPTLTEFFTETSPGCYGKRIQGPVTLIGHRVGFDRPAFDPFIDGEVFELDTLRFVRWLYPQADNHQLSTMKFMLNLPKGAGTAHRALADVMVAYHLAKHIAERLEMSLPELAMRARDPIPVQSLPFGKHKQEPLDQVPRSYLSWALNNMALDSDFVYAIQKRLGKRLPEARDV